MNEELIVLTYRNPLQVILNCAACGIESKMDLPIAASGYCVDCNEELMKFYDDDLFGLVT